MKTCDPEDTEEAGDEYPFCHVCDGDGFVFGDEFDDPEMYDPDETYTCPCCGGSGSAKDCRYQ
jgi:hypothetical protein